ncbi:hypothetical protein WA158_007795 [Blastocystis sp. Blastoise]
MSFVLKTITPHFMGTLPSLVSKSFVKGMPVRVIGTAFIKTAKNSLGVIQFPKMFHTIRYLKDKEESIKKDNIQSIPIEKKKKSLSYYFKSAPQVAIFYFGLYGATLFSIYEILNFGLLDPITLSTWMAGISPKLGSLLASHPQGGLFFITYIAGKLTYP